MNNSVMGLWLPFIGETNPMMHKIKRDALSDYMASRRQALNSLLRFQSDLIVRIFFLFNKVGCIFPIVINSLQ